MSHIHTAMTSSVLPTPQYTSRYLENIPTPPRLPPETFRLQGRLWLSRALSQTLYPMTV